MRQNISGFVPTSCNFNTLTNNDQSKCCPVYESIGSMLMIRKYTAAYPYGLACLASVGCKDHVLYTDLFNECYNLCGPLYKKNTNSTIIKMNKKAIQSRCTNIFSNANRLSKLNNLLYILVLIISIYFLVL